ncbi:MAG: hypothetical protein NC924_09890 [Candidatus Omnitrophica bacterium]|nr:hypothetical protein [Candidatus Omnitrophota bacterium]
MEYFYSEYSHFQSSLLHGANSSQRLVLITLFAAIDYSVETASISKQFNVFQVKTLIEQINHQMQANADAEQDGHSPRLSINEPFFQEFFAIHYSLGALKDYLIRVQERLEQFPQKNATSTREAQKNLRNNVIPFAHTIKKQPAAAQATERAI